MNPEYPIYIISKGRWESRLTSKALEFMHVPYHIIVEENEYDKYSRVIDKNKILVLPEKYKKSYDTFWHDDDPRVGSGPSRNFAWDNSIECGFDFHWVMDDNLDAFHRLNRNIKAEVTSGTIFKCMEDFVLRYENVAIAGPNYYSFCKTDTRLPPFVLNTRIYSCLFIRNDIPYRWRGRYNEDTDLCLRVLKDGWCTIQFNAFLQGKVTTQRMKGGNTDSLYREGTYLKSKMLADMHPDVAKVVKQFNRWHHRVNYSPFKKNKLILKKGLVISDDINNYGMKLVKLSPTHVKKGQMTVDGERELDFKIREAKSVVRNAVQRTGQTPIVINFSGGKDSLALLNLVREETDNFICVYAVSGIDFPESIEFAKSTAKKFGIELLLSTPDMYKGSFFERLAKFKKFPTVRETWCSRDLKFRAEAKMLRKLYGNQHFYKLNGVRRFESARRNAMHISTKRLGFIIKDFNISSDYMVFPILNWTNENHFQQVDQVCFPIQLFHHKCLGNGQEFVCKLKADRKDNNNNHLLCTCHKEDFLVC